MKTFFPTCRPVIAVVACILSWAGACLAQELTIERRPKTNPWTSLKLNNDPKNFQFLIVSDRTGGHRPGVFSDAVRKINLLQPEFVMSVGDMIEGYTRDEKAIDAMWDEFQSRTARLKMPFFYVPGNHDMANPVEAKKWKERFGRDYYHFVYRNVLFLCLNSEDPYPSQMGSEQIEYVRKALEENKDVRWTLVFLHRPLWTLEDRYAVTPEQETPTGWLEIDRMLRAGGRPYTVFAGHNHHYMKVERQDRRYITLSTTGGGSQLRGTPFGEFDHVAWVTMSDAGPVVANLLLSGIWDENVTTEQSKALVDALNNAAKLIAEPLRLEKDAFTGATMPVKLVNDADVPLHVSARFRPSDQVRPDPYAVEQSIEPNSVEVIDLKVEPRASAIAVSDVRPLVLDAQLTYAVPQGPTLTFKRAIPVAVDRTDACPARTEPVVVDGKLDEWKELPHVCQDPMLIRDNVSGWTGPADASFKFATAHDDKFVYVAIESTDEQLIPTDALERLWWADSVEVRVDARPDPERSASRGQNESKVFLVFGIAPGETAQQTMLERKKTLPEGTKVASVPTHSGFSTEIAIPVSYFDKLQGGSWKAFRLNITQNDVDEHSGPRTQIDWRPDWRREESFAGSGTFERR